MEFQLIIRVCKYLIWMILAAGPLFDLLAKLGKVAQQSLGSVASSLADLTIHAQNYVNGLNITGIATQVSQANRMFPFTETLVAMATYAGVKVLCFVIRSVKAWIPTLS